MNSKGLARHWLHAHHAHTGLKELGLFQNYGYKALRPSKDQAQAGAYNSILNSSFKTLVAVLLNSTYLCYTQSDCAGRQGSNDIKETSASIPKFVERGLTKWAMVQGASLGPCFCLEVCDRKCLSMPSALQSRCHKQHRLLVFLGHRKEWRDTEFTLISNLKLRLVSELLGPCPSCCLTPG